MPAASLNKRQIIQGDTFRGRLRITRADGEPKDLTAATARWALYKADQAAVGPYTLGAGIVVEGSPVDGVLVVTFDSLISEALYGIYTQEWMVTDGAGDVQKWHGLFVAENAELKAA